MMSQVVQGTSLNKGGYERYRGQFVKSEKTPDVPALYNSLLYTMTAGNRNGQPETKKRKVQLEK